ncbi:MAG: 2-succinyl-5-enolpyruvyl-6-hydroxy-3-cyclohexene-1-carboxylic-acid synthase [Actinobacteria bacterium]|nr:2-succinyl-5-enolpyruvyl-6-hydroxy-3-cyclohexene-1-carboxylic-acid synthase [Actinomycetota bacterium]
MVQENNLNSLWGKLIIEELIRNGIDYFCISPGSRSTPLTAAIARNKRARKIIYLDERGSAFHALGYAQSKGIPAVVVTTSGTAVANLFPGVVEACQSKMPMIILSADRPPELLDIGANQTINQTKIFGMYAKWYFCFPCPDKNISPKMILTTMDHAVYLSLNNPSGPVHINCMFREPLEPDEFDRGNNENFYVKDIENWIKTSKPYTYYSISKTIAESKETLSIVSEIIRMEKRGLISVGRLRSNYEVKAVLNFIRKTNWPVYADITSNLRFKNEINSNIIKHFDQDILSREFNEKAVPNTVIHFGGRITSKRFDQFLNQNKPENYIIVKDNPVRYDPVHLITIHIESDIISFCESVLKTIGKGNNNNIFKNFYEDKAKKVQEIIDNNTKNEEDINEVFISRHISKEIPDKSCLFLSNSMPIRDMELYGQSSDKEILIGANRGVSGVDGIISTATGFAAGCNKICTLLIGDIAFIHDLNSLAAINNIKIPLIIVLINNNGGGIFDFLPVSKCRDIFEDYFATPHNLNFEGAARTFKINYFLVETNNAFCQIYNDAVKIAKDRGESSIIEIITKRDYNLKLRRRIKMEILKMLEL